MSKKKNIFIGVIALFVIIFFFIAFVFNFLVNGFANAAEGASRAIIDLHDNNVLDTLKYVVVGLFDSTLTVDSGQISLDSLDGENLFNK